MGFCGLLKAEESGKHLFILSGQSNMARFKPALWFTPGISDALGVDKVIVSFHAQGGQPISKWYKEWKSDKGETDPGAGKIYDAMMDATKAKMEGEKIRTATFVWMQGEADSKAQNSDVYLASLNGLKKQPYVNTNFPKFFPLVIIFDATCDHPPGLDPKSTRDVFFLKKLNFLLISISLKADLDLYPSVFDCLKYKSLCLSISQLFDDLFFFNYCFFLT